MAIFKDWEQILPPIHREWDIWILHQKQRRVADHLKMGWKLSFSIKGIDIYVLLCCCNKGKRVKKNDKNKNGTFSVNWPNKKMSHSLWIGGSIIFDKIYSIQMQNLACLYELRLNFTFSQEKSLEQKNKHS